MGRKPVRTALLVRCSADEADEIRLEASEQHRTIGDYVANVVIRAMEADDGSLRRFIGLKNTPGTETRSRGAVLVRCDSEVAERIREGAKMRHVQLNAFILGALRYARAGYRAEQTEGAA